MSGPLERKYGRYRIVLRKIDHTESAHRPEPHVEVWKGHRKVGNFDMATGEMLRERTFSREIAEHIQDYLNDPMVKKKVYEMIQASYFDVHKQAGSYGGIPIGVKVTIGVEFTEDSIKLSRLE